MSNPAPRTPSTSKGSTTDPTPVFQSPSKTKQDQFERALDPDGDDAAAIADMLHRFTGRSGEEAEAMAHMLFIGIDQILKRNNLDRGVIVAPDVHKAISDYATETGRRAANEAARKSRDTESSGEEEPDESSDEDDGGMAETAELAEDTGTLTIVEEVVNDGMYGPGTLKSLHLFPEMDGLTPETYVIVGSSGAPTWVTPKVDFSLTLPKEVMFDRKKKYCSDNYQLVVNAGSSDKPRWEKPHAWVVNAVADLLFNTMDQAGFDNVRALVHAYLTPTSDGTVAGDTFAAKTAAQKESVPEIKHFFKSYAHYLALTSRKDRLWHFRFAIYQIELYAEYQALQKKMDNPNSDVYRRVMDYAKKNKRLKSGRKHKDHVKPYLLAALGHPVSDTKNDVLTRTFRGFKALIALVGKDDVGFLTLLNTTKLTEMSKWGAKIIPHLIARFKEQNKEIIPLLDRLNQEVVKPMLRGDVARIRRLNGASIGRVVEVQDKIDALLSAGPAPGEETTTEDVAMADA